MSAPDLLKVRQQQAKRAHDRMLEALLGYDPCGNLRVADVQYIARLAQTLTFDAMGEMPL